MQRTAMTRSGARTLVLLTFLGMLNLIGWQPILSIAQQPPAAAKRANRSGTKPGEVITPPDRRERWKDQLLVGTAAPEFTLPLLAKGDTADPAVSPNAKGKTETVTLSELHAKRPVVLVFGSISCPPFRGQLDGIEQVYQEFKDRAEFLFVYVREAHPDSILAVVDSEGRESLLKIPQAVDLSTRTATAAVCRRTAKLNLPIAIDTLDNSVGKAYAGWPNRMVVVGTDGVVIYASAPAPRGTNAERLQSWLKENLSEAK